MKKKMARPANDEEREKNRVIYSFVQHMRERLEESRTLANDVDK